MQPPGDAPVKSGQVDRAAAGGLEFHVARALVEHPSPILLDQEIPIGCRTARIGRGSMTMALDILGLADGAGGEDLRAAGEAAHVQAAELRWPSTPVPDWITALSERYEGPALKQEPPR